MTGHKIASKIIHSRRCASAWRGSLPPPLSDINAAREKTKIPPCTPRILKGIKCRCSRTSKWRFHVNNETDSAPAQCRARVYILFTRRLCFSRRGAPGAIKIVINFWEELRGSSGLLAVRGIEISREEYV